MMVKVIFSLVEHKKNKQQYLDRNKESRDASVELIRIAKDVPCADCGNRYPYYVMDLDHLDPSTKLGTVTQMARHGVKKTKEEIAKCEAVCSNCHRERTFGVVALVAS